MQKKKLLGSALTLAMLLPYGPAQAADLMKNLKVDGSIDLQATSANNVSDFNRAKYDQIGDAQFRVLLNAGWDLLDDVHSMVTLRKNDRTWGTTGGNGQPAAISRTLGNEIEEQNRNAGVCQVCRNARTHRTGAQHCCFSHQQRPRRETGPRGID